MENTETNLNVVRRFFDAFNQKDEKIIDEVIADDYVDYGHQPPGKGPQGAKDDFRNFFRRFSDVRFDTDEIIPAGDRVVSRWTVHGTHTGNFNGIPASYQTIAIKGVSLYRLRDGEKSWKPEISLMRFPRSCR